MVKSIEVVSSQLNEGFISSVVKVTTDKGIVGMNVSFKIAEHPGLDALVTIVEQEIIKTLAQTLSMAPAQSEQ